MSEEEIISSINALIKYAKCQKDSGENYKKVASEEKYSESLNRDIESLLHIEPNTNFISKDKIREIIYPTPENYISLDIQQSEMYKRLEELLEE